MQNKTIDILKFLACFFVVAIHITPFGIYGAKASWLAICACRWAVPFFFASSSYLFWKKGKGYSYYARRLLILLLVWMAVYSFYIINHFTTIDKGGIAFIFGFLFGNTFESAWYLTASVEAMGLLWLLRRLNNNVLLLIGSLFYLLSLSYSIYYPILSNMLSMEFVDSMAHYISPTNSFLSAFIYVVLGKIVAEQEEYTNKAKWICLFGLLFSICLGIFECTSLIDTSRWITDAMVCLPILTFCLMTLVSQCSICWPLSGDVCRFLRNTSIIVYLGHHLFIYICSFFHHNSDWKAYCFVVLCSLILASFIQIAARRYKVFRLFY